jgi:NADH-quinone oxidoreductase subunit J
VAFFGDAEIGSGDPVLTSEIGSSIFNRFVIPFEVVSFVLLAALIGGIVLARRDPEA